MTTRVLLVDDDPLVCSALQMMIESADDLTVVGTVDDGDQVIDAVYRHRPGVVLMDVRMQRQDGVATTAALQAISEPPKVLVLTTFDHHDVLMRAIDAGAAGFLLKTSSPQQIIDGVRAVAGGEGVLSERSARQALEQLRDDPVTAQRRAAVALVETLTDRERDVVRQVGRSLTNAQIAQELYLGEATVKSHLASAQLKLGAANRVQVGIIADRAGLT